MLFRSQYTAATDFKQIPGSPIAYWVSKNIRRAFSKGRPLSEFAALQPGLQTSNNSMFVRCWHEVSHENIGFSMASSNDASASGLRWFPYNKGGDYRLWYGNNEYIVDWQENGKRIKEYVTKKYPYLNGNIDYVVKDRGKYFLPSVTW